MKVMNVQQSYQAGGKRIRTVFSQYMCDTVCMLEQLTRVFCTPSREVNLSHEREQMRGGNAVG